MSIRDNTVGIAALWLLAVFTSAHTAAQESSPYDLVQSTTEQVMEVVVAADEYVDAEPDRYYTQIQDLLDPLIDFRGFARNVMGPYANSKRYRSLDEAGRQQLKDQLNRFTAAMRASLVRTYSNGLLAFGGSRIEVIPPEEGVETDAALQSVRQLIFADRSQPYEVLYQMGLDRSGDWKLRNVIIEDVNLGEIYRDQFLTSAREQDGNLEAVIDTWTIVVVEVDE